MNECIIAISSMTYAIKGENVLKKNNIPTKIVKLSSNMTKKGCAYGLKIDCIHSTIARWVLENNGIPAGELVK